MHAAIRGIEYVLPKQTLDTSELSRIYPGGHIEKIDARTGIHSRHIAAQSQTASDLAFAAATKLFDRIAVLPARIDYLLLCTQSPECILPSTACLLQHRLEISEAAGAFDFNLGCSGFVYGLGLAEGLIASEQARSVLLITADTITKYIDPNDKGSRAIFGDAAAATLIEATAVSSLGPFVYGTNGEGGMDLTVPGIRIAQQEQTDQVADNRTRFLFMDGGKIFDFALKVVPAAVQKVLWKAGLRVEDFALFVFHQANTYLLEELAGLIGIPREKMQITIAHCGNTGSCSIPIALRHAAMENRMSVGDRVMLVGFGVGYSWSATILRWTGLESTTCDGYPVVA
jgi:3-oxoacyl-[acyl-carrier-protein] synthase III